MLKVFLKYKLEAKRGYMKILNFGSLNIDYVYSVNEFVKAGETIPSKDLQVFCGGKGLNQSIAMAKAGLEVFHAGCIGMDGDILRKKLIENKIDVSFIRQSDSQSGHAIIQVNKDGQNCILLYAGSNHLITEENVDQVLSHFSKDDIMVLQNEITCLEYIARTAYQKGIKIMLNPSPVSPDLTKILPYVNWLILNEEEGTFFSQESDPYKTVQTLVTSNPSIKVVLTLGKDGVVYHDSKSTYAQEIFPVDVVDTTAAGDTFAGYFLASVANGRTIQESLRISSKAASIAVSRKGASDSIPTIDEVVEFTE